MDRRALETGSLTGAVGSALASAAASICCVGPIAITLLGVQGAIWAAGVKPYRYYVLAGSLAFIALAYWIARRPPRIAEEAACDTRTGRVTRVILAVAAIIWVAALALNIAIDKASL